MLSHTQKTNWKSENHTQLGNVEEVIVWAVFVVSNMFVVSNTNPNPNCGEPNPNPNATIFVRVRGLAGESRQGGDQGEDQRPRPKTKT